MWVVPGCPSLSLGAEAAGWPNEKPSKGWIGWLASTRPWPWNLKRKASLPSSKKSLKIKILVDLNVFEDILRQREGWIGSRAVLDFVRKKRCEGYISALSLPILYFFRLRLHPEGEARRIVKETIRGFQIIPLDRLILKKALQSDLPDFEDNIQFFSAKAKRVHYLVTRNRKDYQQSQIPAVTPEQFMGFI